MPDDRGKQRPDSAKSPPAASTPQPSKIIEALERVRRQKIELAEAEVRRRAALARSAAAMASLRGSMSESSAPPATDGDVEDIGPAAASHPNSGEQSTKGK
ncbi:MAG: hypothetical protein NVSMB47_18950 [Polyangiales bacterium]